MKLSAIEASAATLGVFVMGLSHPHEYPDQTLVILGAGPDLWQHFRSAPEYRDGDPDPLDRWSKRVIGTLAGDHPCLFPSDGPPYAPFIAMALQTGQFFQSPTGMMVHARAGLLISIRGAILLPGLLPLPASAPDPCQTCADRPCVTACPVGALSAQSAYDVPMCKDFIRDDPAQSCMETGCATRNACPLSQQFARDIDQTRFHMRAFRGAPL